MHACVVDFVIVYFCACTPYQSKNNNVSLVVIRSVRPA